MKSYNDINKQKARLNKVLFSKADEYRSRRLRVGEISRRYQKNIIEEHDRVFGYRRYRDLDYKVPREIYAKQGDLSPHNATRRPSQPTMPHTATITDTQAAIIREIILLRLDDLNAIKQRLTTIAAREAVAAETQQLRAILELF